jgi:hypothetical protein
MFSIHDFIMKTLRGMVGNYPDFQIMEYALNWYEKGKLSEEDLAEVESWFEPEEEETPEAPEEEQQEETEEAGE